MKWSCVTRCESQAKLKHMLHAICEATSKVSMICVLVLITDLGKWAAKQIPQKLVVSIVA